MPHELRDLAPALDYIRRSPDQGFAMLRSLRRGLRPGLAAIVDRPEAATALLLVERPDWRGSGPLLTRVQLDATDAGAAVQLLSWIPPVARVQVSTYRPWLHELVQGALEPQRLEQRVHCLADRQHFRPGRLQSLAVEIGRGQEGLRRQAEAMGVAEEGDRLFGIVRGGELVACASLGEPELEYVSVRGVFTRAESRLRGYGSAVLSAATQAGLQTGRAVTYGLPVTDVPALHLVAGLGFTPVCREWTVEGHLRQ